MTVFDLNDSSEKQLLYISPESEIVKEAEVLLHKTDYFLSYHKEADVANKYSIGLCEGETKSVYLTNDYFGLIPLFFEIDRTVQKVFLSDQLADLPGVSKGINESRVLKYLRGESDEAATFFSTICKLPAGSTVKVTPDTVGVSYHRFCSTNIPKKTLIQALADSISNQRESPRKAIFHTSGGLDSSSIAALGRDCFGNEAEYTALKAFDDKTDESKYQTAFEEYHNVKIKIFEPGLDLKKVVGDYVSKTLEPPLGYNTIAMLNGITQYASQNKAILFTGYGGDGIIGHGFKFLAELIQNHDYEGLKTRIKWQTKNNFFRQKYDEWDSLSDQDRYDFTAYSILRRFIHSKTQLLYFFIKIGGSFRFIFKRAFESKPFVNLGSIFTPARSGRITMGCYLNFLNERDDRLSDFQSAAFADINQTYYNIGRINKVDIVHPFLCNELIQLFLKTSEKEKYGEGEGRAQLRKAMKGHLPELILNRIGKTSFDSYLQAAVLSFIKEVGLIPDDHGIWRYVNKKFFEKVIYRFKESNNITEKRMLMHPIHRVLNLKIWLDALTSKGLIN